MAQELMDAETYSAQLSTLCYLHQSLEYIERVQLLRGVGDTDREV